MHKSLLRAWLPLVLVGVAYLYAFPYYPEINNPNENVRLYMTAAIVEQGSYEIGPQRARWGWTNDAAELEGRHYSVKAPLSSFLAVPAYALYYFGGRALDQELDREVALWVCRISATTLPALLFLFFFLRWMKREGRHQSASLALFYTVSLGSLFFGYAIIFVSHGLAGAAAFGAFMILEEARRRGKIGIGSALLAGVLAASVTALEYPSLFVSVLLCIYALLAIGRRPQMLPFLAGALIPTLMVMHFQHHAFGNALMPGHLYVENDAFRHAHEEGLYGATGIHWDAALGLLFNPAFGLFPLSPLLALALPGCWLALKKSGQRAPVILAMAIIVATYVPICFMNNWRGGWTLGPRYLATMVPFVAYLALPALDRLIDRLPSIGVATALAGVVAALLASGLPSIYYPHLPENVTRPLTQLFPVLIAHDFAPTNAGRYLGLFGSASMAPLLLVALIAGVSPLMVSAMRKARWVLPALLAPGLLALFLLPSLWPVDASTDDSMAALAFITRAWSPSGHDRAAQLSEAASGQPTALGYRDLEECYREEGRMREASVAWRRAASLDRGAGHVRPSGATGRDPARGLPQPGLELPTLF